MLRFPNGPLKEKLLTKKARRSILLSKLNNGDFYGTRIEGLLETECYIIMTCPWGIASAWFCQHTEIYTVIVDDVHPNGPLPL